MAQALTVQAPSLHPTVSSTYGAALEEEEALQFVAMLLSDENVTVAVDLANYR